MAHLDVAGIDYRLADGRPLLRDVSLRVGEAQRVALIGANGAGKTTLLRLITGDLAPDAGAVTRDGSLGVMRQFVTGDTVGALLLSVAPLPIREAAAALEAAERAMAADGSTETQMRYATALATWGEAGGYEAEVLWDVCTVEAPGMTFEGARQRPVTTLSGGEQKRLTLEALLRGPDPILRSEEHTSELQSRGHLVCRLLLEKKNSKDKNQTN